MFKMICSIAVFSALIWLYFDRSLLPFIGVFISSVSLAFAMFGKKSDVNNPSSPTFTINSGSNSNNNQAIGNINQTIDNGSK